MKSENLGSSRESYELAEAITVATMWSIEKKRSREKRESWKAGSLHFGGCKFTHTFS